MFGAIHRCVRRSPAAGTSPAGGRRIGRRILILIGWVVALLVQAVLIILVSKMVELAQDIAGLYLDLARQQLELTSIYVSATSV
jgi:hypothetical protein